MRKSRKMIAAIVLMSVMLAGCAGTAAEEKTPQAVKETDERAPEGLGEAAEGLPEIPGGLPEGGLPEGGLPEGGLPEGGFPEGLPPMEPGEMAEINGESEGNVAYADISESQTCDIYKPEGEGPFPVIVLVHGGGFLFGDQRMELILPVIETGVERGYAVVSVDYRKSAEAVFPAALADVKAAVRFVRANAETYGFDPEHIAVWGESAGAYLSLMTALTPEVEELNGDVAENTDYSSSVAALVDFYGPVEFYT
ncbi:MAG: alpha/beta hydrolase, partial [Lachnospiraceae bacterium]|nr:alpha/beta hydrolase [Lachnospiraceae bacterium]